MKAELLETAKETPRWYSTFMSVSIPGAQAETFCPWLSEQPIKLGAGSHYLNPQWDTSELGQEPVLDLGWP